MYANKNTALGVNTLLIKQASYGTLQNIGYRFQLYFKMPFVILMN